MKAPSREAPVAASDDHVVEAASTAPNSAPMTEKAARPQWLFPVIAIVALLGIVYVVRSATFSATHEVTDDAFVTSHVINVSPQIQGIVSKVFVEDNQEVKKGDLLVQMDDTALKAAYDQAKANLDLAVAQAEGAQTFVSLTSATGKAQMQQALGAVSQNAGGVSSAVSDEASARADEANADALVSSAQAGVGSAQAAYVTAVADVARAKAGVASAQADLQTAVASSKAAHASVGAAQAAATRAANDSRRAQSLFGQGAISAQAAEAAQAADDSARANLDASKQQAAAADAVAEQRKLAIESARQQFAASQAVVDQTKSQIAASQAQVVAARAGVARARAANRSALGSIVQAKGRAAQAAGQLALAAASKTQLAVSESAHKQALARVEQAKAALNEAATNLGYTKIYASQDGRVSKLTVTTGALVQPLFPLMSLIPSQAQDPMWVVANFKETQLTNMRVGQPVEIDVDGVAGVKFTGKVDSLSAGTGATFALLPADNATGNFTKVVQRIPVKVDFNPGQNGLERLASGMSATVTVATK